MLDDLNTLRLFVRIVDGGSLSAAARELGLSLPAASKRLARLESGVGMRLLQRTTRRQSLTHEGALFHMRAVRILDEVDQTELLLTQRRDVVSGLLRITAPAGLGRLRIAPILAEFQRLHPALSVQLELTDAVLDLLDSGMDVAVRYGGLEDSSCFSRLLAPSHRVLCASPDYLRRHGVPATPAALSEHSCLIIGSQPRAEWRFDGDPPSIVRVQGGLSSNDGDAVHRWALDGAGIALKSIWDVAADLEAGRLRRILPTHSIPAAPLHAIYPHNRHLAPRVRAFIDYLGMRLRASSLPRDAPEASAPAPVGQDPHPP